MSGRRDIAAAAKRLAIANRREERRFVGALGAMAGSVAKIYERRLAGAVLAVGRADAIKPPATKASPWRQEIDLLEGTIAPQLGPAVAKLHAKLAKAIIKNHTEILGEILRLPVSTQTAHVKAAVEVSRNSAIEYVEKAHRVYATQVRELFGSGESNGLRVEVLRDKLLERGDVSRSRAELIARDQTLKLAGSINEARQKDAGLDSYTWSTSNDERVRPEHAALNGQIFTWAIPPEPGSPGQDFQCRCIAVPYVPELVGI